MTELAPGTDKAPNLEKASPQLLTAAFYGARLPMAPGWCSGLAAALDK